MPDCPIVGLNRGEGRNPGQRPASPDRAGAPPEGSADFQDSREKLGFTAQTDFETGLRNTIAWHEIHLSQRGVCGTATSNRKPQSFFSSIEGF